MRLILAAAAAVSVMAAPAVAQNYPNQPVRMIVGSTAGGGMDTIARTVAQHISTNLGQQVVVENKPGAGGTIGMAYAAGVKPDGYTIILSETGTLLGPMMFKNVGYDPVKSFAPIAHITSAPFALVAHPSLGVSDMAGFIKLAKANPGKYFYANAGVNTLSHLMGVMIFNMADIKLEPTAYQGGAPSVAAVVSGEVQTGILSLGAAIEQAAAGKIKILGITYSERLKAFPDLPTIGETVKGFAAWPSQFLLAPAGTPPDVVKRLSAAVADAMGKPELPGELTKRGFVPDFKTAEVLAGELPKTIESWNAAAKSAGVTPN